MAPAAQGGGPRHPWRGPCGRLPRPSDFGRSAVAQAQWGEGRPLHRRNGAPSVAQSPAREAVARPFRAGEVVPFRPLLLRCRRTPSAGPVSEIKRGPDQAPWGTRYVVRPVRFVLSGLRPARVCGGGEGLIPVPLPPPRFCKNIDTILQGGCRKSNRGAPRAPARTAPARPRDFWPDNPVNVRRLHVNLSTVSTQVLESAAGDISGRACTVCVWPKPGPKAAVDGAAKEVLYGVIH